MTATRDQRLHRVNGLAVFEGIGGERWTKPEMAPIVAAMTEINEGARRYFQVRDGDPLGITIGWCFYKRPCAKPFWSFKWGWVLGSWGDDTPDAVAERLRKEYAWALSGTVMGRRDGKE